MAEGIARVAVVVFDGLRPDRVTPQTMPHLDRFRAQAASFDGRSVFPA